MTRAHPLLMAMLLGASLCNAQPVPLDSLRAIWVDTTLSARDRVPALAQWMDRDSTVQLNYAIDLTVPPRTDTTARLYMHQKGLALLARGSAQARQQRVPQAMAAAQAGLALLQRAGLPLDRAVAHTYIAMFAARLGRAGEAVEHQMLALQGYEALKDSRGLYAMTNALAFSYSQQGLNQQSIAYYKRNLAAVRGKQPDEELDLLVRIADQYQDLGDRMAALAWLDSAEEMRTKGALDTQRIVNWMRGDMYLEDGRCEEALHQFQQCFEGIELDTANHAGRSWIRSRVAMAHICAKRYAPAVELATEGLDIAEQQGLRKEMLDNLYPLATAYEDMGDTRAALRYYKRYHALLDSVINTESASKLTDAALTSAFEKEQFADSVLTVQRTAVADADLARERTRRNLLLVIGAVAVVLGAFSYRQRLRTQRALQRSDELLLNILPRDVAEELKTKGHAEARHFDRVTILFTDFQGFTEVSERLSPQELLEELNACFKAFDGIVLARGIEKIKTIGDAYMCAGGLSVPNSSTPVAVVHAALEMQAFMRQRKSTREAQGLPAFAMRAGIHTGPVVAGIVGTTKFQYDVWGDTVNIASRMESSGEVGHVNISEATYELVKKEPGLSFTARGKVQAKGKGEMEMYFVEAAQAK